MTKLKFIKTSATLALALFMGACCTMGSKDELKAMDQTVDVQKFMGSWYVISSISTAVEKGANNAVENYTWNEKEERIDVDYHHNQGSPDGELKSYPQKAWIYNKSTNAEWRVRPIWPLKFAYLIVDLAPDYSTTIIGVPNRKYVWIMARTKTLPAAKYDDLVAKVAKMGYDTSKLQKVPQF
jgi:apolipoprotein D and lipocalin family protein